MWGPDNISNNGRLEYIVSHTDTHTHTNIRNNNIIQARTLVETRVICLNSMRNNNFSSTSITSYLTNHWFFVLQPPIFLFLHNSHFSSDCWNAWKSLECNQPYTVRAHTHRLKREQFRICFSSYKMRRKKNSQLFFVVDYVQSLINRT